MSALEPTKSWMNLSFKSQIVSVNIRTFSLQTRAETKARNAVLPYSRYEPFGIQCLSDLFDFLKDPFLAVDKGLCSPGAGVAWFRDTPEEVRENIKLKSEILKRKFPTILGSIKCLENCLEDCPMTAEEAIQYFSVHDAEVANALREIEPIIEIDWSLD